MKVSYIFCNPFQKNLVCKLIFINPHTAVILNVHHVVLRKEDVIVLLVDCHTWLNHTIRKDALKRLKLQRKEYRR